MLDLEQKLYSVKLHLQTHGFFYKSYYSNLELHVHVCYTQASLFIGTLYMYIHVYVHVYT